MVLTAAQVKQCQGSLISSGFCPNMGNHWQFYLGKMLIPVDFGIPYFQRKPCARARVKTWVNRPYWGLASIHQ